MIDREFHNSMVRLEKRQRLLSSNMILGLRKIGFKACIPNNGWVKRDRSCIIFEDHLFLDSNLSVGDMVAIGSYYDKYVDIVKISWINHSILDKFLIYYGYESIGKTKNLFYEEL